MMTKKPSPVEVQIAALPAGLDRAVLRILSYHVGRANAIGRQALLMRLGDHGFKVKERAARLCISQLRKAGSLICSAPGEDGGYYLPQDAAEFDDFVRLEYEAKIIDMRETLSAMQRSAERTWGRFAPDRQASLF